MRVLASALAWLAACAGTLGVRAAIANIDTDGFVQDGLTTYCEGITESKGPLVFEHLLPSSAGKCPVRVTLATTRRTNSATGATEIWVDWNASVATSVEPASSLFPRAVDATTGIPQRVIASLVRACTAGSNCATDADVLVPAAVAGDETSTGEFDGDGAKTLRKYVFGIGAGAADLVVVAKVVLPGDAQLNISATEFITFQRVRIGASATQETTLPGTVRPSTDSQSHESSTVAGEAKTEPAAKASTSVDAQDTNSGAVSTPTRGGTTNIIVLSSIAGLGFIIAVAYFATSKKGNQDRHSDHDGDTQHTSTADTTIYRLTDAAKLTGLAAPSQRGAASASAPANGQPQQSRRFQPRQPRGQAPWQAPAQSATPSDERPPALYPADLMSHDALTVSSHAEPSTSHDSPSGLLTSQLTSFNSLHDSAVTLPEPRRTRRASSASSYADELDDSDPEEPSRLFTESHISEVLQHHHHETQHHYARTTTQTTTSSDDRSTQLSTLSWLQEEEDRDSDLAELTTAIHERYPPRKH